MMLRSSKRTLWIFAFAAALAVSLIYIFLGFTDQNPIKIRVIIKSSDDSIEFWQVMKDGIDVAAKEFGANVEVIGSVTEADVDGQIALVEKVIQEQPDAIILAANDYNRLVPVSEKVRSSGILFFIVDSGINSDIARSLIATDNIKAGQQVGAEMQKRLSFPAKVAIINYVRTAASLIDREKGVRSVLAGNRNITLLDTYYADGREENAYKITKQILSQNPDVHGIIGLNEPASVGAGRAIQEMELKDQIKLIGFDSSVNEIKLLEEGVMQATVIQKPFQMGYISIKTAVEAIHGKKVPRVIDTGSLIITKQNMYEEENQKLLFPFYDK
jgi:ribose transport system substrate-binding protein